jgi:hypothetical protein
MSLLARVTDYVAGQPILSDQVDGDLNGLYDCFRGTSTNKNLLVRFSDVATPVLDLDQLSSGLVQRWKKAGVEIASLDDDGNFVTSGGATFGIIPVGPNSDPTTANELARKSYVDSRKTRVSVNWFEADPSTSSVSSEDRAVGIFHSGQIVLDRINIWYLPGSHTSGGSLTYFIRVHDGNGQTDLGSLALNDTNNAPGFYSAPFSSPYTLVPPAVVTYYLGSRSGTITERSVNISTTGYQTPT